MKKIRILFFIFALLTLSSCSKLGGSKMTPELKIALIRVSGEYLDKINNSGFNDIQSLIIWSDYLSPSKALNKESFVKEVALARQTWKDSPKDYPLVALDLEDMSIKGNDALVRLKKTNSAKEVVEIRLRWNGQGWLVYDDNIFGQGRLMQKWIAEKR